jgi:hypothetical protein
LTDLRPNRARTRIRTASLVGCVACGVAALAALGASACGSFSAGDPSPTEDASTPDVAVAVDSAADSAPPDCDATGTCDAGPEPLSLISPYRDGGLTYPATIVWTLSALNDALIHYTTDGTDPTLASKSGAGTVTLQDLVDGTVIKWTAGSSANVHSFAVHIDGPGGGSAQNAGVILQNFRFATTTTAITAVPRGVATINVRADISLWNQSNCSGCVDFLTLGIDKPSDCFAASIPGTYPGAVAYSRTFVLTVPAEAGVYPIRIGYSQVFDCNAALATPLSDTQVGLLVVTP